MKFLFSALQSYFDYGFVAPKTRNTLGLNYCKPKILSNLSPSPPEKPVPVYDSALRSCLILREKKFMQLKNVVAKVDKWHFSKNEFFIDFKLFAETNFPEKKIVLIFNQFLVINSLICCTWQEGRMEN